ncbi:MAG: gamma-glutamylcyclotransferase [Confluentimicrobium sp.]|jgi:cation transport protein ChaC|uniref:gamma-glutamylcyclotransferase n=1 Tax=Actibacterium sp. TaxID=1872125 RepID=UPI00050FFAE4|nr:gamma-glutamylcyclotransferase [Actibacterium sp.]KGB83135.1 gamma-glutamyl cyclotransferase [Rhodovulum sp. NI22]MBC56356.1 gamma-glutamylcyclotransferase [Actibacterium sp.]MDY6859374.1 gamma-glutamylcyclotransferase [Pseudomonadota bacterium]|tara:strand:+ start:3341 stop:3892 length:552 start_codon:yes stop_codon:yes gene_type:complete
MPRAPLWVFGYGSLMWNPGFAVAERQIARLADYHRSFCMRSVHHRGTPDEPGLVLALDATAGAACTGLAFRVEPGAEDATVAYLQERELISSAYLEAELPLDLRGGPRVRALTFIIDPDHVQYCGGLPLEEQAGIIARAVGGRGPNTEYLYNTAAHLAELGIEDAELSWLTRRVREITTGSEA